MFTEYKTYNDIKENRKEILRYLRVDKENEEITSLIDDTLNETKNNLSFKVAYNTFDISVNGDIVDFPFASVKSNDLIKYLGDAKKVVIFVATVGIGIDMLINKYSKVSPSKSVAFQAIGTSFVEELCDRFTKEIRNDIKRYSPGYGDLSLEFQKDIFKVIDTNKIGVSLGDNLLMSPSKTVSAIVVVE